MAEKGGDPMDRRKLFAAALTAVLGILLAAGAQKKYVQTDQVQTANGKVDSTVTPLKYKQETDERLEQLKSWRCPYTMYNGQYFCIRVESGQK